MNVVIDDYEQLLRSILHYNALCTACVLRMHYEEVSHGGTTITSFLITVALSANKWWWRQLCESVMSHLCVYHTSAMGFWKLPSHKNSRHGKAATQREGFILDDEFRIICLIIWLLCCGSTRKENMRLMYRLSFRRYITSCNISACTVTSEEYVL